MTKARLAESFLVLLTGLAISIGAKDVQHFHKAPGSLWRGSKSGCPVNYLALLAIL